MVRSLARAQVLNWESQDCLRERMQLRRKHGLTTHKGSCLPRLHCTGHCTALMSLHCTGDIIAHKGSCLPLLHCTALHWDIIAHKDLGLQSPLHAHCTKRSALGILLNTKACVYRLHRIALGITNALHCTGISLHTKTLQTCTDPFF